MKTVKNIIFITLMLLVAAGGTTSCKSKKKIAKQEYEAKLTQAKNDLNAIINGETSWSLGEQSSRIDEIEKADFQKSFLSICLQARKDYPQSNNMLNVAYISNSKKNS